MTIRRRTRVVLAVLAVASLVLAACGSRIDEDTIARAATATGATAGTATGVPGQDGTVDAAPGEAGGPAAMDGTGTGTGSGTAGGPGQTPGQAGKSGRPGGPGDSNGPNGSAEPIAIGSVGTYSGAVGSVFAPSARALQAWASDANSRGGIDGRPVKVIVMDDGGSAATSRAKVRELVETHKVVAIVSANVTTASLNAWKGYVAEKKVPVFGGSCGPGWEGNPVLFNQCPFFETYALGLPVVGAKYGTGKKFGALLCREDPVCANLEDRWFTRGYAKRAGLEPVYRAKVSLTQPDFTSECIQARNAGVQLLTVIGTADGLERVAASCRRQNFRPQFLEISAAVNMNTPTKPGLENVLNTSLTFPFAGLSSAAFREFDAAWKKYGGGREASAAASQGWAAAKIFEKAARKAGSSITRDAIIKAMYSIKNERFGGSTIPLSFGPQGTKDSPCVFVMKGAGGRWTAPQGDKPTCW